MMDENDYTYLPDEDGDDELGVPYEMQRRAMLAEAVILADDLRRELRGEVKGLLAEYVKHALKESAEAAAMLITMHPKNERELFELQKRAAPYACVMEWIRNTLREGVNAEQQMIERQETEDG